MFFTVHINSIDIGPAARAANQTSHMELWVSAQPTKNMGTSQPIKVTPESLLNLNLNFQFELNPKLVSEKGEINLKITILKKRFIGSENLCESEFNFLKLPQNQTHRSLVGMNAFHQTEKPQLDLVVAITDHPDCQSAPPYQCTNLENYLKVAGIAVNGAVTGNHTSGSGTRLVSEASIFTD